MSQQHASAEVQFRPLPPAAPAPTSASGAAGGGGSSALSAMAAMKQRLQAQQRERMVGAAVAARISSSVPQLSRLPPPHPQAAKPPSLPPQAAKPPSPPQPPPPDDDDDVPIVFNYKPMDRYRPEAMPDDHGRDPDEGAPCAAELSDFDRNDNGTSLEEFIEPDPDDDGKPARPPPKAKRQGKGKKQAVAADDDDGNDDVAQPPVIIHVGAGAGGGGGGGANRTDQLRARVLQQDPADRHKYYFSAGLDDDEQARREQFQAAHEDRVRAVFGDPGAPGRPADDDFSSVSDNSNDGDDEDGDMVSMGGDNELGGGGGGDLKFVIKNVRREKRRHHLPVIDAAAAEDLLTPCWLCGTRDMDGKQFAGDGGGGGPGAVAAPTDFVFGNVALVVAHYMGTKSLWTASVMGAIYYYNHIFRPMGGRTYFLRPQEVFDHFFGGECIVEPRFTQAVLIRSLRKAHRVVEKGVRERNALTGEERSDRHQVKALCDLAVAMERVYKWDTKKMAFYAPAVPVDTPQANQLIAPRDVVRSSRKERQY